MNTMIKGALRKTLRGSRLTYEELETIVFEIEAVINSRPLCYIYDDEVNEPLTPSHLMYGRRLLNTKGDVDREGTDVESEPKKRYKYLNRVLAQFQQIFQHQYLTALRERDLSKTGCPDISVGDVVLIKSKDTARSEWPLGKVERLVCSDDNVVRGAVLKTKSGKTNRSINLLYPLEIRNERKIDNQQNSSPTQNVDSDPRNTENNEPAKSDLNDEIEAEKKKNPSIVRNNPRRTTGANRRPRREAAVKGEIIRRKGDNV